MKDAKSNCPTGDKNIGEQRRLESISRRQQEERRKKQIISESLANNNKPLNTTKHIKFECSSEKEENDADEKEANISRNGNNKAKRCFFLDINDPEIRCTMSAFRRHISSEEQLRKNWVEKRKSLVKFYKHERKLALKNLRSQQEQQLIQNKKPGGGDGEKETTTKNSGRKRIKPKNI